MTEWNEQAVTDKQKEAAIQCYDELKRDKCQYVPWAYIDKDGGVGRFERHPACTSSLYSSSFSKKGYVLFQFPVFSPFDKLVRDMKLSSPDDLIKKYVNWVVKSQLISKYLCKHTEKERYTMGIPIATQNVPTNGPLMASTFVRYLWDKHNAETNCSVPVLRSMFPRMKWAKIVVFSQLLSRLRMATTPYDVATETFYIKQASGCHALFGLCDKGVLKDFVNDCFDHEKMDHRKKFNEQYPGIGWGNEATFNRYKPGKVDYTDVVKILVKAIKKAGIAHDEERFSKPIYNPNKLRDVVNVLNKELFK